ncbi:MAG: hypothetical protein AAB686_03695 [Patescibacteria group bacterium]
MNVLGFFKYTIWPAAKVRLTYWWWIVKYGGKKNIPLELIFGKINRSVEGMRENLMLALRHMPDDMSEEEKEELLSLLRTADDLERKLTKPPSSHPQK